MNRTFTIGIVGARGHVGAELIQMIAGHPRLTLDYVASRSLAGLPVRERIAAYRGDVVYEALDPADVAARDADIVVLALPNGGAAPFVAALESSSHPTRTLIDLSADYRFDDAWFYGLPELTRKTCRGQTRISNPGCYATAMQLAIAPMRELLAGPAQCFGVSGYSGAGTKPSDKNDPEVLRENFIPYSLTGHVHEREASRHLGHAVEFMPHVAPHFRGLSMTVNLHLQAAVSIEQVIARYHAHYGAEPLVRVQQHAPRVRDVAGKDHAEIGGFALAEDSRRLVCVATLDNLRKGAATQALQNLNLALGLPELEGIAL